MHHSGRFVNILVLLVSLLLLQATSVQATPPLPPKAAHLLAQRQPAVQQELTRKNLRLGMPVFMRIFKMEGVLEVWMQPKDRFVLFKSYPICAYSGFPGPKLHEGDWQSPEGFYRVTRAQMHPNSRHHLAFNIGYPNELDRQRQRTGSAIMVHGECSSRGCFAMGNQAMEEIFLLAHAALAGGQESFAIHIFPFRLTQANLHKFRSSPWLAFWKSLEPGFSAFETSHQVPDILTEKGHYVIRTKATRLALAPPETTGTAAQ